MVDMVYEKSNGKVLVVEDDILQSKVAIAFVNAAGFETIVASNANDALWLLETRFDIQTLFTDIEMPGLFDGLKLAFMVRKRWPAIDIIIASSMDRPEPSELPNKSVYLPKPYGLRDVSNALSTIAA